MDYLVQVIRNITESSLFVASASTLTSTPSTTSAATATHDDSQSGSDLARFVAAVLREEVVDELIKENNELKSRENKHLLVQITGPNCTPIHYEGSFKNAEPQYSDFGTDGIPYTVGIGLRFGYDGTTDDFPLRSIGEIEIRSGGVVVQRFNIDDLTIQFVQDGYDEESPMQFIALHNLSGSILCVDGKIGPLPLGWGQNRRAMLLTDFFELVADENNGLTPQTLMVIHELIFDEKDISGLMSVIRK